MSNYFLSSQQVAIGPYVEPINRISLYSAQEWEEFTEEWLEIKQSEYVRVERFGGAGDMGRDVVAYIDDEKPNYKWDCYQCKHYKSSLAPSDVWQEFGKIIYYTFMQEFPIPRKYFFVAPHSVGTKLSNLLNQPDKLKQELKDHWESHCKNSITNTKEIPLEGALLEYFEAFDFSIFDKKLSKEIIEEYKTHSNYVKRFGGGLPPREKPPTTPSAIQPNENRYIQQLILAYGSDRLENSFKAIEDLAGHSVYNGHFARARESFHIAEQFRNFSRDNLGEEVFDDFQQEIYHAVVDIAEEESATNGFVKVKNVELQAAQTAIESNPLKDRCFTQDKKGICHQLANDGKLTWIAEDE